MTNRGKNQFVSQSDVRCCERTAVSHRLLLDLRTSETLPYGNLYLAEGVVSPHSGVTEVTRNAAAKALGGID